MEAKKMYWVIGILLVVLVSFIAIYSLKKTNINTNPQPTFSNLSETPGSEIANLQENSNWCKKGASWSNERIQSGTKFRVQTISVLNNETICIVFNDVDRYAFNQDESHLYKYVVLNYSAKERSHFELIQ